LKDGAPLVASNRLRTRYDIATKQVLLQINDVRPQDIGEYVVIASNPAGEVSTVGSLSVVPDKPGVDDRAFVPTDKFRNLEQPKGQRRPLEILPGVEEVSEEKRPPRVLVPLKDSDLEELMPVILTTKIDAGSPMSTVRIYFILSRKKRISDLSVLLVHLDCLNLRDFVKREDE
jgi:hypothetical protein